MAGSLSRREGRRALTLFAALAVLLALVLFYDPSPERIVWGLALLLGTFFLYFMLSKAQPERETRDGARGIDARWGVVLILPLLAIIGVLVYPSAEAFVVDFVPELVRRFLQGLAVGLGLGSIIYAAASYEGSYGRTVKVISIALGTLVLLVVGAYVLIEYVAAPLIRAFA